MNQEMKNLIDNQSKATERFLQEFLESNIRKIENDVRNGAISIRDGDMTIRNLESNIRNMLANRGKNEETHRH